MTHSLSLNPSTPYLNQQIDELMTILPKSIGAVSFIFHYNRSVNRGWRNLVNYVKNKNQVHFQFKIKKLVNMLGIDTDSLLAPPILDKLLNEALESCGIKSRSLVQAFKTLYYHYGLTIFTDTNQEIGTVLGYKDSRTRHILRLLEKYGFLVREFRLPRSFRLVLPYHLLSLKQYQHSNNMETI